MGWLVFCIMNGATFLSQYLAGGRASVVLFFTFFLGSLIIFILSIKYGVRDTSRWDRILFGSAIIMIIIWVLTRNNHIAIWLTVIIDFAAMAIMVLKVKNEPNSEDPQAWLIATVAFVFTCLTLIGKPLSILYVRPVYGLVSDVVLLCFIYYYRNKSREKIHSSPLEV